MNVAAALVSALELEPSQLELNIATRMFCREPANNCPGNRVEKENHCEARSYEDF